MLSLQIGNSMLKRHLSCVLLLAALVPVRAQNQVTLDSLLGVLRRQTSDSLRASTLLDIALLYSNNDYAKAIQYAQQSRDLAAGKGLVRMTSRADRAIGRIYGEMGDYKKASSFYFQALKSAEQTRDTFAIVTLYNNLGTIHDRLHEYDRALEYYFKAQDLVNTQPAASKATVLPTIYNNIANIYQSKGDFPSAKDYYEKTLALSRQTGNKSVEATANNNLGKLYFHNLRDNAAALPYLKEGLRIRKELGDKGEMAKSLNILSNFYIDTGDYPHARESADETIAIGAQVGSLELQSNGYLALSRIESAMGRHKEALAAYQHHKLLSDSIHTQEAAGEMARLQFQYDFDKAEHAHEQERRQTRARYQIAIAILGVGLTIAVLLAFLIRARGRQTELKRQNLAQDVEIKNKELTTNVLYLVRKNELINSVAERLLQMQSNVQDENRKIIQEIIIDLQREADSEGWKEFELRFNQVHREFYVNLRKLYPHLSPAEEKLCAFLRLNMSSKEIAAITQQSIKSVEVARARLRKKLNLTNTTSNLVVHLSGL